MSASAELGTALDEAEAIWKRGGAPSTGRRVKARGAGVSR